MTGTMRFRWPKVIQVAPLIKRGYRIWNAAFWYRLGLEEPLLRIELFLSPN